MAAVGKAKKEAACFKVQAKEAQANARCSDAGVFATAVKEARGIDRIETDLSSAVTRLSAAVDAVAVAFNPAIREGCGIAAESLDIKPGTTQPSRLEEAMRMFNEEIDIVETRLLDLANRSTL